MKIQRYFVLMLSCIAIIAIGLLGACSEQDSDIPHTHVELGIEPPSGVEGLTIVDQTWKLTNLTTGRTSTYIDLTAVNLMEGLYDCVYSAHVTYLAKNADGEENEVKGILSGKAENVEVTSHSKKIEVETGLSIESDDFIFEEIFFTGTRRTSGSSYIGDTYFKIYNNTDHVLYADGLAFVESKFRSTQSYKFSPDLKNQAMTVHAVYVIPGSGTDHPVLPGQSLTICDTAIDHRVSNENSFNLSDADFEWYDESTVPSQTDIDNPEVPNMDKWYCDTKSIFILHNQGFTSFALARIPVSKQEFLTDYYYTYNYTLYLPSGTFPMSGDGFKIPNQWIVDGVNCSVESDRKWNVLPAAIDAGWTWCGRMSSDSDRFFKSVRRKMLYLTADGRRVLKDSNNSSLDFNPACTPSIIEVQQSAVNASGEKASTITYDGVQIIK